ncbi:uncharacterized protein LOC128876211 [Hylaeus volcanicus]|uniref:uncharacterized protein LOC128876211 n=1 Tax=Hylaeus volcanicus TaxID=313075 RepID=UPI0023B7E2D6|nr:uncharacterized protein LOC128876211 [Hylaeus volcanicus]
MQLEGTEKELLINIDCPLKLILNYIRNAVNLENTAEFDLCDEISCQLRKVSFFEPRTSGLDIFDADLTYLIVIHQRDSNGQMINFTPLLTGKTAKRCTDILLKNHTSHRKGSSVKSTLKIKP